MASAVPITTTIDNLIQRIEVVKVCHEDMKSIATSLARLQDALNNINSTMDTSRLHGDIFQTLKAIDKIVTGCSENETDLNGITYRDIQSLLLRLHLRLAQHEADLTDDYEMKVQILSNAYQEQQILVQKAFDKTIKQRLEVFEQRTKENTIEQLRVLREKHTETIKSYLSACIELHKSVPITGLTGSSIAKVAHIFYQVSSEDQVQLEHSWQTLELPLTRTFTQFKPDKSTSFERNESRRLLFRQENNFSQDPQGHGEASKSMWQKLVSAPYMMSMIERDQKSEENSVNEENIIRTKRWIVILGDPGSGKTSFARWLVHHLAQTLLLNGQHSTEYGPLRIPILIRMGEFAEMLRDHSSLTLFDYIGKHKWMGKTITENSSISVNKLSCALQDYIKHGQALIILDGLDEIPVSDQRSKIINIVENFVDAYVQTPTGASVFDNPHLSRLFDEPSKSGGNQLIVTSRIVGYHAAPLAGQFAHYTIRPMDMEHMKDFVDYWFYRVHQHILDTLHLSSPNQGENHGEALKKELEKPENINLLDVASNSCLLSFICSVAFSQSEGSPLPTQRICLYEQIVNSMLSLWSSKRSTIPISELIRILSDIATYIHEHSASGLIHEETMKEVCIQSIQASFAKPLLTKEDIKDIESQASEFVRIIREDVGILAARGESLYGFLHLTFQEYFTCLKLIDVDKLKQKKLNLHRSYEEQKNYFVAQLLRRHTHDPRFRVPIALALGKISSSWSQKDFDDFCYEFIKEENESNSLIPLGAFMLIVCGNDLVNYPSSDVLFDTLDRLMTAAGQHRWAIVCPFLFDQITAALKKFRHDIVSLWVHNLLSRSSSHDIQTISALCHLIEGKPHEFENIKWLNQSSCSMLQSLSTHDNESNEFAIDRLLVKITFTNHRLLPVEPTTLKGFLLGEEIELNFIPVILLPLIISLYGGLKRDGQTVIFDPSHIHRESSTITPMLIRFLSIKDRSKQDQGLKKLKQECIKSFLARTEKYDESSETVDLCIGTICFYDIEYIQENMTIISNTILRMAMNRLKYISMILRQFYFTSDQSDRSIENETTKFISIAVEKFQYGEASRVQFLDLLDALRGDLARLRSSTTSILIEGESKPNERVTLHLPNALRRQDKFLHGLLSTDVGFYFDKKSCSLLPHFIKLFWISEHNDTYDTQYRVALALDTIPKYLVYRNEDVLSPLTFVPQHLRNLYLRLLQQKLVIINSNNLQGNDKHHLYFGHILTECIVSLSNTSCKRLSLLAALVSLLPMLRIHELENFGGSLLWTLSSKDSYFLAHFENSRNRRMDYQTGLYTDGIKDFSGAKYFTNGQQRLLIRNSIEQEHQRLQNALAENDARNIKLYSSCISLAYVCRWSEDKGRLCLLNESVQGAMSITNALARLDALCVIAFYSHFDYDQIKVRSGRSLQQEIEHQFNDIYPTLPLLLHTAIFIRCLPLLQHQTMIDACLQNLSDKFSDNDQRDQQAVNEALTTYLQSRCDLSAVTKSASHRLLGSRKILHTKSCVLKKYFHISADENLSFSVLISNLYLLELAADFHACLKTDVRQFTMDQSIVTKLCQFESSILTEAQAIVITNVLSSACSTDRADYTEKLCSILSNALHRVSWAEFKACQLLKSWLKWKNSNTLYLCAYHAALLLSNSDIWSIEVATILCDLLCNENDRFRQRAEVILRSTGDNVIRTSSKLGIDVILTLIQKRALYRDISPSANITILRMCENITLDIQSHLETVLWLERYRIHALVNKQYSIDKSRSSVNPYIAAYFSTMVTINASLYKHIYRMSNDLIIYICDMIASNLFSFLEIDGDTTSNEVLESHNQFVALVVITVGHLYTHTDETRPLAIDAFINLLETSKNDDIRQAAAYALGFVCDNESYKILFNNIQMMVNNERNGTFNYSHQVLSVLISSYCHLISVKKIAFDQDDMDLFCSLLKHSSQDVFKAVRTGFGRVLKDKSFLFDMLGGDPIQCYHALIDSTAYAFLYDVQQMSGITAAEFIEEHPDLLSIFLAEFYNAVRPLNDTSGSNKTTDYYLSYAYPQYFEVSALIAVRMPAAFCSFIKDWSNGDSLKRALFDTRIHHDYLQRAACLTILSIFGELTIELCEMIVEALRDDPHVQNTCYKCLTRITSVKDEKVVLDLLFSYLTSKSLNIRYVAARLLLHLSKSSLIPFEKVRIALTNLMLESDSNEGLWLIEEQDGVLAVSAYFYAGSLKDVIYSLLVQHLTGDASGSIRRNELNDVDANFVESEKASRLASCLYETTTAEDNE